MFLYILLSSVFSYLRWCGLFHYDCMQHLITTETMEKLQKSVTISQSYSQIQRGMIYGPWCIKSYNAFWCIGKIQCSLSCQSTALNTYHLCLQASKNITFKIITQICHLHLFFAKTSLSCFCLFSLCKVLEMTWDNSHIQKRFSGLLVAGTDTYSLVHRLW